MVFRRFTSKLQQNDGFINYRIINLWRKHKKIYILGFNSVILTDITQMSISVWNSVWITLTVRYSRSNFDRMKTVYVSATLRNSPIKDSAWFFLALMLINNNI